MSYGWNVPFLAALFDLSLPKKKIKDERRKKKMRTIKVESEDPCEILAPSDAPSAPTAGIINSLPDTPSTPLANIKEEWVFFTVLSVCALLCMPHMHILIESAVIKHYPPSLKNRGGVSEQPGGPRGDSHQFLQLVGEHLKGRKLHQHFIGRNSLQTPACILPRPSRFWLREVTANIVLSQLEDKVQMWQFSPASSLNVWFSSVPCWSDLVLQALQFLAGETKGTQRRPRHPNGQASFSSRRRSRTLCFRWYDGAPQRIFSFCGIFWWISAVELDRWEGFFFFFNSCLTWCLVTDRVLLNRLF